LFGVVVARLVEIGRGSGTAWVVLVASRAARFGGAGMGVIYATETNEPLVDVALP
jgi:hypothetical protein